MIPYYTDPLVTLIDGDCIEVLATLEADSVDAVVTDPPYGLEFMGKEWDSYKTTGSSTKFHSPKDEGRVFTNESGHFWDNTKALPRLTAGHPFQSWCEQWGREALRVTKPGGYLLAFGGTRTHHRLVCALEDAGWIIRDELDWIYASGFPKGKANLKPAHEPIVLARKPGPLRPLGIDECRIPGVVPQTVHGVSSRQGEVYGHFRDEPEPSIVNEGGRWPSNVLLSDPELFDEPNPYVVGSGATTTSGSRSGEYYGSGAWSGPFGPVGRDLEGDSGGYSRFFLIPKADRAERERGLVASDAAWHVAGTPTKSVKRCRNCDSSRLGEGGVHICKPDCPGKDVELVASEVRSRANVHPTVKPIDLMRHLVRLVTPTGGVVLDPFLGSGTTCLAASEEGFRSIGIEREAEYLEIAKGRLMATPMGLGLDVPAGTKRPPKTHPDLSKHQPKRRAPGENYSGRWAGTDEEPAA